MQYQVIVETSADPTMTYGVIRQALAAAQIVLREVAPLKSEQEQRFHLVDLLRCKYGQMLDWDIVAEMLLLSELEAIGRGDLLWEQAATKARRLKAAQGTGTDPTG